MQPVKPHMKLWARTGNHDGRLPLHSAAAASLKWADTKLIFESNMMAIYDRDIVTGLSPFMLASVGQSSDIESIYRLLRENPAASSFATDVI